jgi:hypothetical protein
MNRHAIENNFSHVESEVTLDTLKGVRGGEVVKMIFEGGLEKIKNCSVLNTIKICNLLIFISARVTFRTTRSFC